MLLAVFVFPVYLPAQTIDFDDVNALKAYQLTGKPTLDQSQNRNGKGGSLKLAAGDAVVIPIAKTNQSGSISFWVYDDATPASDNKKRQAGGLWGVADSDGNQLLIGSIYAPYLNGAQTYSVGIENAKDKIAPWQKVQYLGIKRKAAWQQWTITWDDKGLSIFCDGKDVNAARKRFDPNKATLNGFIQLVFVGDRTADRNNTIWIDDIQYKLGKADLLEKIGEPVPKVIPDVDPSLQGEPIKLNAEVMATHPRILFGKADIKTLRDAFNDPQNKVLRDNFMAFLPSCNVPDNTNFLTDATDGQRQGYWRLPTRIMHYLMTGDTASRDKAIEFLRFFLKLPNWETTQERDSGMSAANIMIGMALAYDALCDELDPQLRDQLKDKLWQHARAMYHGGHLMKNPGTHYWQGDPQNNHHWHRTAGALLCALAAYDGKPDQQWLIKELYNDVAWLANWLPVDGTSHESATYLIFGVSHLTFIMQAADRCFDTSYLQHPFFKHFGEFLIHTKLPGVNKLVSYGDSGGGFSSYGLAVYKAASVHQQIDIQQRMDQIIAANPDAFPISWYGFLWRGPTLKAGEKFEIEHAKLFDDIGMAIMRDGWEAGDVVGMFKCGPLGGYTLNRFRNLNDFRYINVAHDDPDANSFVLFKDGDYLAQTDRYSKHKQSANHNTILINGMGQRVPGRGENMVWSQPATGKTDMTKMAVITAWQVADNVVAVEGEASGAYLNVNDRKLNRSRPKLDRYRRMMLWVKGDYVLVLDDIRAPEPVEITWLMQGNKLLQDKSQPMHFTLRHDKASCSFAVTSLDPEGWQSRIVPATADHRGKNLGFEQLQLTRESNAQFLASLYLPWGGQGDVTLTRQGDALLVQVKTDKQTDSWLWAPAADELSPSHVTGKRGTQILITVDENNSNPPKR
jgi:hypothetical protein